MVIRNNKLIEKFLLVDLLDQITHGIEFQPSFLHRLDRNVPVFYSLLSQIPSGPDLRYEFEQLQIKKK